jgi:pSer/pThr/pTyr-binding forkhead associated (FHA) protein
MSDLNKKTLRHFYCRDVLWQSFERMSEDLDRGVDDLVNEAMRLFAREKGYLPPENESRSSIMRPAPNRPPPLPPPSRPALAADDLSDSSPFLRPEPPTLGDNEGISSSTPLYLVFQNQKYLIDKEQFIIGRGSKTSDLPIRDGNISRKHAAVIRKNGGYYIKDLGSTNGIDHNGVRVDNKKIEEGDVFSLCDYQLKFTFR